MNNSQQSKASIRQSSTKRRQSISPAYSKQAAIKACHYLARYPEFLKANNLACYLANASEFHTEAIIELMIQNNKNCYLPVIAEEKKLIFVRYKPGDVLHRNQHRILEPQNKQNIIQPDKLDIVILPLTAYDSKGNRLGSGAGYYDRTFEFTLEAKKKKPLLIGLAFDQQCEEEILVDQWDIKLDGVLTETGIHLF